jgi:hypothetical protein
VEAVEPPRPLGAVGDEAGVLEQAEMAGDRGAADRQRVGDLPDRSVAGGEQLDDRAAVRVAERVERVTGKRVERDWQKGS